MIRLYKAKLEYSARNSAEIDLTDSDILVNIQYEGDGKARGTNVSKSSRGYFPIDCIEPLAESELQKSVVQPDFSTTKETQTQTSLNVIKKESKLRKKVGQASALLKNLVILLFFATCMGCLMFYMLYSQYAFTLEFALSCSISVAIATLILLAITTKGRCTFMVMIPGFCTSRGRAAVLAFVLSIALSTSGDNIARNLKEASRSAGCYVELFMNQSWTEKAAFHQDRETKLLYRLSDIITQVSTHLQEQFKGAELKLDTKISYTNHTFFNTSRPLGEIKEKAEKKANSYVTTIVAVISVISKAARLLSVTTLLFLLYQSYSYVQRYLEDNKFDNQYVSKQLKELDASISATNEKTSPLFPLTYKERKKFVGILQLRLTRMELLSLLFALTSIAIYFVAIGLVIYFDFMSFKVLSVLSKHSDWNLQTGSSLALNFSIEFSTSKKTRTFPESPYVDNYTMVEQLDSGSCMVDVKPPNEQSLITITVLLAVTLLTAFFQAYIVRIRHRIAGFFYPEQSRERLASLYNEISKERHQMAVDVLEKLNYIRRQNKLRQNMENNICNDMWVSWKALLREQFGIRRKCLSCEQRIEMTANEKQGCPSVKQKCKVAYLCYRCRAIIGWSTTVDTCVCEELSLSRDTSQTDELRNLRKIDFTF